MTRLSNRQYPMLRLFATERADFHMSIEDAQGYDQRPFRSMLIQQWIAYRPGRGFHITKEGRKHWEEFGSTSIARVDPTRPLTAFFDLGFYGLGTPKQKAVAKKEGRIVMAATVREALNKTRSAVVH